LAEQADAEPGEWYAVAFASACSRRAESTRRSHPPPAARVDAHYDIRTIQELLGHKDVPTTMIHTHGLNKGGRGVQSPADRL